MTIKTNLGLVEWALAWLGRPYWYGTVCYQCTDSLLQRKSKQYPSHYGYSRMGRYRADIQANKSCCDCVGLIKGYYWQNDAGKQVYKLDGRPDTSANGMFNASKERDSINTLPEIPGMLLWSPNHIGVYIGNGYAIEARGFNFGVVKTKVNERPWTHWCKCRYIDYIIEETPPQTQPTPQYDFGTRLLKYEKGKPMLCGEDVRNVQKRLIELGFKPQGTDGIFGRNTAAAVNAFQSARKLDVDGIVGKQTKSALKAIKE